jgi:hypothetical protein
MPRVCQSGWQDVSQQWLYCHWPGARHCSDAGHIDVRRTFSTGARRVRAVLAEMNYASSRATALRLSRGLEQSERAPDTYAEFLLRTSVTSLSEPPARCR